MKRTEFQIEIKEAVTPDQMEYLKNCFEQEDFKSFLGNFGEKELKDAYLFYYKDMILGVFWPQITTDTGVKVAMPNIYMTKRKSRFTLICIGKMIADLFEKFHVHKMYMAVYDNNESVVHLMHTYHIYHEGVFRKGIRIHGELVDINFFSILEDELEKFKVVYKEIYGL